MLFSCNDIYDDESLLRDKFSFGGGGGGGFRVAYIL